MRIQVLGIATSTKWTSNGGDGESRVCDRATPAPARRTFAVGAHRAQCSLLLASRPRHVLRGMPRLVAFTLGGLFVTIAMSAPASAGDADDASMASRTVSIMLSPPHLSYPMLFVTGEVRLRDWMSVGVDIGGGAYLGGKVGQLGMELALYPAGSFVGGLQLGPFVRATALSLPNAAAQAPPPPEDGDHRAMEAGFHDVEDSRAYGASSIAMGVFVGGKYVVRGHEFPSGLTLRGGLLGGKVASLGASKFGPNPYATNPMPDRGVAQAYLEVGWTF